MMLPGLAEQPSLDHDIADCTHQLSPACPTADAAGSDAAAALPSDLHLASVGAATCGTTPVLQGQEPANAAPAGDGHDPDRAGGSNPKWEPAPSCGRVSIADGFISAAPVAAAAALGPAAAAQANDDFSMHAKAAQATPSHSRLGASDAVALQSAAEPSVLTAPAAEVKKAARCWHIL